MPHPSVELVADVVQALADAQIETWLFGGWAEELSGLCPPRLHRDIDLLYPAQDFDRLEEFLRTHPNRQEVRAKRFPHKRAWEWQGVLIEVFLLRPGAGELVTDFFGELQFVWPQDTLLSSVKLPNGTLPCASVAALRLYRARHGEVEQAVRRYRMLTETKLFKIGTMQ